MESHWCVELGGQKKIELDAKSEIYYSPKDLQNLLA